MNVTKMKLEWWQAGILFSHHLQPSRGTAGSGLPGRPTLQAGDALPLQAPVNRAGTSRWMVGGLPPRGGTCAGDWQEPIRTAPAQVAGGRFITRENANREITHLHGTAP